MSHWGSWENNLCVVPGVVAWEISVRVGSGPCLLEAHCVPEELLVRLLRGGVFLGGDLQ